MRDSLRRQVEIAVENLRNDTDFEQVASLVASDFASRQQNYHQQIFLRDFKAFIIDDLKTRLIGLTDTYEEKVVKDVRQAKKRFEKYEAPLPILPSNCKFANAKRVGNRNALLVVVEQRPTIRTMQFQRKIHYRSGKNTVHGDHTFDSYSLAFPYVYFRFYMWLNDDGKVPLGSYPIPEIGLRGKPLSGPDDYLCYVPLPNTSSMEMCAGNIMSFIPPNIQDVATYVDAFVSAYWNGKHTLEMAHNFQKAISNDEVWYPKNWAKMSKQKPLFALTTNWENVVGRGPKFGDWTDMGREEELTTSIALEKSKIETQVGEIYDEIKAVATNCQQACADFLNDRPIGHDVDQAAFWDVLCRAVRSSMNAAAARLERAYDEEVVSLVREQTGRMEEAMGKFMQELQRAKHPEWQESKSAPQKDGLEVFFSCDEDGVWNK